MVTLSSALVLVPSLTVNVSVNDGLVAKSNAELFVTVISPEEALIPNALSVFPPVMVQSWKVVEVTS